MRTGDTLDEGPRAVSINVVLGAIGRELDGLGDDMDRLQEELSPALMPVLLAHPEIITGLQELDRLSQTLRALSSLVQQIGTKQPEAPLPDLSGLIAAVPLGDLASRLMRPA